MLDNFLFAKHLEDDEHISVIVHSHWITGVKMLVIPAVFFLFGLAILALRHSQTALVFGVLATFLVGPGLAIAFLGLSPAADILLALLVVVMLVIFTRRNR